MTLSALGSFWLRKVDVRQATNSVAAYVVFYLGILEDQARRRELGPSWTLLNFVFKAAFGRVMNHLNMLYQSQDQPARHHQVIFACGRCLASAYDCASTSFHLSLRQKKLSYDMAGSFASPFVVAAGALSSVKSCFGSSFAALVS